MLKNFLTRISAPITKHVIDPISRVRANLVSRSDVKRTAAHATLGIAVRELSEGSAKALALPPVNILKNWDSIDLSRLSVDQLEDLGRAHNQGVEEQDGNMVKNPQRAVEIFQYASERGSQTASYSYAICLKDGIGIEKDVSAAYDMLSKLANENDYNLAHYGVAVMLSTGEVAVDHAAAFKHFDKAARLGVLPAIYNVGNYHSSGLGGAEKNENRAYQCYLIGAQGGDPSAMYTVGTWIYQGRNGLERDLIESFKWQKKAADAGHPLATFNIGHAYLSGEGTKKDINLAIEYYEKSANYGLVQAAINVGNIYRTGAEGVEINLPKAREYLIKYSHLNQTCAELVQNIDDEMAQNANKK